MHGKRTECLNVVQVNARLWNVIQTVSWKQRRFRSYEFVCPVTEYARLLYPAHIE